MDTSRRNDAQTQGSGHGQSWEREMVWSDWAWSGGHRSALVVSIDVDGIYGEVNHHGADDSLSLIHI